MSSYPLVVWIDCYAHHSASRQAAKVWILKLFWDEERSHQLAIETDLHSLVLAEALFVPALIQSRE